MNYIYCITNIINNKRYVGKTTQTLEERFKKHCKDSFRDRYEKRPLYDAINKYGIENFIIEELEQVEDETKLNEREIYWIQELQTYDSNGYNATKGGDGKILYDYKEIIDLANLGNSAQQISDKLGCCLDTIYKVIRTNKVKLRKGDSNPVEQYSLSGEYIQTFFSLTDAMDWLIEHGYAKNRTATSKIGQCCKHKSKTAFKFKWEYSKTIQSRHLD